MDTRKVTLIATIAAIALLAVGIGYAYTASTINSGNTATSEYLTIVQDNDATGDGAYTFADSGEVKINWDSADSMGSKPQTKFTLTGTVNNVVGGYALVKVGDSFVLKVAPQNGGTYYDTLTCQVDGSSMPLPTIATVGDYAPDKQPVLFLVVETNNSAETPVKQTVIFQLTAENTFNKEGATPGTYDGGKTFTVYKNYGGTQYNDVTVTMYYGYIGTEASGITVTHAVGTQPKGPSSTPLSGAELTFTIEKTPAA